MSKLHGVNEAEFAVLVSDDWHDLGLGTELLKRLIEIGREEKLTRIVGQVMPDNHAMHHICQKVGFKVEHDPKNDGYYAANYSY